MNLMTSLSTVVSESSHWDLFMGGSFLVLFAAIATYAVPVPQGDRRWWGLVAAIGALVVVGMSAVDGTARTVMLDLAAFLAVALVWVQGSAQAVHAARNYLVLLAAGIAAMTAGLLIAGESVTPPDAPLDHLAVGLLVIGFSLKLAFVPFYVWLPLVAEAAAPMTTALIVATVDIAAFNELAHLRTLSPWIFEQYEALWIGVALLSMFGGALFALAQRDLKRMLAFSTIDDMGYLLLGVVVGPGVGLEGALVGALSHALFKVLLFGSVGLAEHQIGHALTLNDRGLAARCPAATVAFIAGALGMIGVPPIFGFAGRWRLYLAGADYGGAWLIGLMALATALALIYYVRAIHTVWLGQPSTPETPDEPPLASAVLLTLTVLGLALGLLPSLVTAYVS
jgi:multicomponent Na+:H+ antiporter subunit D